MIWSGSNVQGRVKVAEIMHEVRVAQPTSLMTNLRAFIHLAAFCVSRKGLADRDTIGKLANLLHTAVHLSCPAANDTHAQKHGRSIGGG